MNACVGANAGEDRVFHSESGLFTTDHDSMSAWVCSHSTVTWEEVAGIVHHPIPKLDPSHDHPICTNPRPSLL
eukprot:2453982-Rhodomonas_salina.2